MKKYAIIGLVLAAFCALTSCNIEDVIKKGGTIIVKNEYRSPLPGVEVTENKVTVIPLTDLSEAANIDFTSLLQDADIIKYGQSKSYSFNKDGFYSVVALWPTMFHQEVTLLAGTTTTVTIKE